MNKVFLGILWVFLIFEIIVTHAEYKHKKQKEAEQKERERIKAEIREWREKYNRPHPKYER